MSNFICEYCLKVQHKLDHECHEHLHFKICKQLGQIYAFKNMAYGDAFGKTFRELGIISALTRMVDKMERVKKLVTAPSVDTGDESIEDTLRDLANYCIMTLMEISKAKNLTNDPNKE